MHLELDGLKKEGWAAFRERKERILVLCKLKEKKSCI